MRHEVGWGGSWDTHCAVLYTVHVHMHTHTCTLTHTHTHTHTHTRTSVDPTSSHRIQLSDDIPNLSSVDAAANEDVDTSNEGLIKLFNLQGNI